jgi:hypothetical protein
MTSFDITIKAIGNGGNGGNENICDQEDLFLNGGYTAYNSMG